LTVTRKVVIASKVAGVTDRTFRLLNRAHWTLFGAIDGDQSICIKNLRWGVPQCTFTKLKVEVPLGETTGSTVDRSVLRSVSLHNAMQCR
jgi:hypothetical protein